MSIRVTVKPVVSKPVHLTLQPDSTLAELQAQVEASTDISAQYQHLFLNEFDLMEEFEGVLEETTLEDAGIVNGTVLKLLRDEGDDEDDDSNDDEGSVGSLEDFIVSDDEDEDADEDEEEEEDAEQAVGNVVEAGGPSKENVGPAAASAKKRSREPEDEGIDTKNIVTEKRQRRPVERFIHPDVVKLQKTGGASAVVPVDESEGSEDETNSAAPDAEASEEEDFEPDVDDDEEDVDISDDEEEDSDDKDSEDDEDDD